MPFANYSSTNEAQAQLAAGITASSNSLILETGYGALFPSGTEFFLKIEAFDDQDRVTKREIVLCTNRVDDVLSITRSSGSCPASYSATAQTTTAFAFAAGDTVSLVLTSEHLEDVQTEVDRLETDKLDNDGGTRTGMTAKAVFVTDASGDEVELTGTDGQVVGFGAANVPMAVTPTVDINALTEDTSPDIENDFLVQYDASAWSNKKFTMDRYRATDSEASVGTSETKFVTASQAGNTFGAGTDYVSGNSSQTYSFGNSTPDTKWNELLVNAAGTYTYTMTIKNNDAGSSGLNHFGKLFKNGVTLGLATIGWSGTWTYTQTANVTLAEWDLLQVYVSGDGTANFTSTLKLEYAITGFNKFLSTVNL